MSILREAIKSQFSPEGRKAVRRTIDGIKWIYKGPARKWRASQLDARIGKAAGRGWRSDIPFDLHYSIQRGLIEYTYRGIPMLKHPVEIAHYMRLIWECKPRTIIEIGSHAGGSAVWLSDIMQTYGIDGQVISCDIRPPSPPVSKTNVKFLYGDVAALDQSLQLEQLAELKRPWLVIEDASHRYADTLAALRFFGPKLHSGEYLIVEDGNVLEMGDDAQFEGGPARAIAEFLDECSGTFRIDERTCDWYGRNVSGNPNGYLIRT